jgi:superfamily II DNA or RNA helicase
MIQLRDYQLNIINNVRALMCHGNKSILVQSPCGSGKTLLTAHMLKTASSRGKRSFFIVHRRELIKQSLDAFSLLGLKPGIISSGWFEIKNSPIQIASIQTLSRRLNRYKVPDLVVWDEVHHVGAKTWGKVYEHFSGAYHIGLTATPCRLDGTGLDKWFSKMVSGPSVQWLIDNGFLSKYKIFAPGKIDTSSVHSRMGDYITSELLAIVDRPTITGDAIKHYKKLCPGKRAIVFCVSIEHSKHVVEQFNASGIPAEHIDGETEKYQRDAAIKRFADGKTTILSNVDLVGEGFDLPAIEVGILLRPTQSLGMYIQQSGRALRPYPGKECAFILDHAGNCQRHGLPCDDREWTLKGSTGKNKQTESSVKIKTCPRCYAVQFSGREVCSYCGYEFDKSPRKVDYEEGNLVEVDLQKARRIRLTEQGKAESFEALVALGRKRGYKRPFLWAKHVLNARKAREAYAKQN